MSASGTLASSISDPASFYVAFLVYAPKIALQSSCLNQFLIPLIRFKPNTAITGTRVKCKARTKKKREKEKGPLKRLTGSPCMIICTVKFYVCSYAYICHIHTMYDISDIGYVLPSSRIPRDTAFRYSEHA